MIHGLSQVGHTLLRAGVVTVGFGFFLILKVDWCVVESESLWHRLDRDHLHKDFLGILKSLVKRFVCCLQIEIVANAERHTLHFLLGVDKCDVAAAGAQDQLRLVLEHHLDDFVGVTEQDGFLGPLPLFDVDQVSVVLVDSCALGCVFLGETEFKGLELLVAIEVALEVLEQDDLLVN